MTNIAELIFIICLTPGTVQIMSSKPPNMEATNNITLGFAGDLTLSTVESHSSRVMCVLDSWAIDIKGHGKFAMADVDANLCTHMILRSAGIKIEHKHYNSLNFVVQKYVVQNYAGLSEDFYKQAVGMKAKNKNLKVILSLGVNKRDFKTISAGTNAYTLSNLANKILNFLKDNNLDGVNVEWIWPKMEESGVPSFDWFGGTNLIAALSKAMEGFELILTLPSNTRIMERNGNIPVLDWNVDYLILIGADLAGHQRPFARHNSPLFPLKEGTVGNTVKFVLGKNISSHRLILGIPFVGRMSTLKYNAPGSGLGTATEQGVYLQDAFQKDDKVLNYDEICYKLKHSIITGWTAYEDKEAKVPFMKHADRSWVSFENTKSVQAKVEFGEENRLGGYAAWSIMNDDFKGDTCGEVTYPLLRTINYVLSKTAEAIEVNPTIPKATGSSDTTTNPSTFSSSPKSTPTTTSLRITEKVSVEATNQTITQGSAISRQQTSTTKPTNPNAIFDTTKIHPTPPQSRKDNQRTDQTENGGGSSVVIYVVVTVLGMILLLVASLFLVRKKRNANKNELGNSEISRFKNGYTYNGVKYKRNTQAIVLEQLQAENHINCSPYDSSLEIPHTEYEIYADEILGSGAYGVVLRGKVRNKVVAVKTVKPLSSTDHVLSLLEEIKVMMYLGKHDNILGLIGANTALIHPGIVYVFVELCPLGSLEKYLKTNKSSFMDLIKNDEFTCEKSSVEEEGKEISSATLLIWAKH